MSNTVRNDVRELKIEELDGVAGGLLVVKHIEKASPKLFSDATGGGSKGHRVN